MVADVCRLPQHDWQNGMFLPGQGPRDLSLPSRNPDTSLSGAVWVKFAVVKDALEDGIQCVEAAWVSGAWWVGVREWGVSLQGSPTELNLLSWDQILTSPEAFYTSILRS